MTIFQWKTLTCLVISFVGASALAAQSAEDESFTEDSLPKIARPNAVPDETCAIEKNDPYENPARMTNVSMLFGGQCINTDRRRVPKIFPDQTAEGVTPVANIRNLGDYWIAYIPFDNDDAIESINFLLLKEKDLFMYSGHGQVEIVFKNPIALRAQEDLSKVEYVDRLYYSVEAAVPVGVDETQPVTDAVVSLLSIKSGMYPLVGRIATAEERQIEDQEKFWKYERYPTHLQPGEKAEWLKLAMVQADHYGFERHFSMLKDNCVATEIDLFDQLPRIQAMGLPKYHTLFSTDPGIGPAKTAMLARGLIDPTPLIMTKTIDPDLRPK